MTGRGRAGRAVWGLALGAAAGALGACAAIGPDTPNSADIAALPAPQAAPDDVAGLLAEADALSAMLARAGTDPRSVARLNAIVGQLVARGAAPADGQADLVTGWQRQAAAAHPPGAHAAPLRGRVLGPLYRRGTLAPKGAALSEQAFLAGQPARVALAPARGALALELFGEPGHQRVRCRAASAYACEWLPLYTQRVRLVVRNRSDRAVTYFLIME